MTTGQVRLHDTFHDSPAHADILHPFSGPPKVRAANERRWFILALVYTDGGVYQDMWLYTPPVYISHIILEGLISLERLDRFGFTIASMIGLAHADVLQLSSGPPDVCAANDRKLCI